MSPFFWILTVVGLCAEGMTLVLTVAGALVTRPAPLVTGLFGLVVVSIALLGLWGVCVRPLVIHNGVLVLPKQFRRTDIPLSRLAAAGLIYQYTPGAQTPEGWTLCIWDDGGNEYIVWRWVVVSWNASRWSGARSASVRRDGNLLPHEDWSYLASSRPGRVATDIYRAAEEWQKGSGPLTTLAMQKSVRSEPLNATMSVAWWSPDGTMGRAPDLGLAT